MFNEVVNKAIEIAKNECTDQYALSYIHGISLAFRDYGDHGADTNLLYAITNMSRWRGEKAKECKTIFKNYLKSKGYLK